MADDIRQHVSPTVSGPACPDCGFAFEGARCPLCFRPTAITDAAASAADRVGPRDEHASQTFALSTLFLFVTLVAVCLGLGLAAPGLGILLAVLAVPAFVRASASSARQRAFGGSLPVSDKVATFLGSLGVVALIIVAGCAAFFAACYVGCVVSDAGSGRFLNDTGAMFLLLGVPALIAVTLIGWLFYKTWPRRHGPR